ncbi:uncharacterized protein RCO7_15087 [Rhynchosporium graminicola]|uniref:Uncharacterized protein n=1 Tax=Rhynchosporium graminicola TaxID=2792576 RepID=A0A1E1LLP2_9HELO|nr:uncharacterized protein RCO7_15087 [Rhynchosporium commune]
MCTKRTRKWKRCGCVKKLKSRYCNRRPCGGTIYLREDEKGFCDPCQKEREERKEREREEKERRKREKKLKEDRENRRWHDSVKDWVDDTNRYYR